MKVINKFTKGFAIGFINSFLGSGGGILAVSMFKKDGKSQNEAHANSIFLILLLTIISVYFYSINKSISFTSAVKYIPLGIIGSIIGALLMPKIPSSALRKILSAFMIWAGVRILVK